MLQGLLKKSIHFLNANISYFKNSFFAVVVVEWNNLDINIGININTPPLVMYLRSHY